MTQNALNVAILKAGPAELAQVWQLLEEYFDAVQVVVRDTHASVANYLEEDDSGTWLAYSNGHLAGCIALRPLPANESKQSGEVKRLYVRSRFRRTGLAKQLLSALESHATAIGLHSLYLDSKDDLVEARAFYESADYRTCPRYNDNPQATVFMKKALTTAIQVRPFRPGDEAAFFALNEAWISKLFKLEPKDLTTLREPETQILSKGGYIYMACQLDRAVGCCALLDMGSGTFEVSKMGVAESERGKGVGRFLLQHVVDDARRLGISRLYLETNHILKNAIHLYESIGFRHLSPEEIKPSPYARADVYMEMKLL